MMPVLLISESLSNFESLLVSSLGFLIVIVFVALILLFSMIRLLKSIIDKLESIKASLTEAPTIQAPPLAKKTVPFTNLTGAGEVNLYDTDDRTAAMLMAIVSDTAAIPLNELRFKSIRENCSGASAVKSAGNVESITLQKKYNFQIKRELSETMKYSITLNGKTYDVEVEREEATLSSVSDGIPEQPAPAAHTAQTPVQDTVQIPTGSPDKIVKAPLPGVVLSIAVNTGDTVKTGQVLMLMEAMKMEIEVAAPFDGKVAQILVSKGTTVSTDSPLIVLA